MNNKISSGVKAVGLGLFFEKESVLAIADFQLGYEEHLHKKGFLIPRFNFKKIKQMLKKMFQKTGKLKKIIINGDLKHEFGSVSEQEWKEVIEILRFIQKNCEKIVLVKGNHDNFLKPVAKWENLKIVDEFFLGKILFVHGHKIPKKSLLKKSETIVIAHEHPAIVLSEGIKSEKFKCFLKGKFKEKELIVLPSMNFVAEGTDVLNDRLLSPFLKQAELKEFEAWLFEEKPYYFGKLKQIE